jgi:hypothetical protein
VVAVVVANGCVFLQQWGWWGEDEIEVEAGSWRRRRRRRQ